MDLWFFGRFKTTYLEQRHRTRRVNCEPEKGDWSGNVHFHHWKIWIDWHMQCDLSRTKPFLDRWIPNESKSFNTAIMEFSIFSSLLFRIHFHYFPSIFMSKHADIAIDYIKDWRGLAGRWTIAPEPLNANQSLFGLFFPPLKQRHRHTERKRMRKIKKEWKK